VLGYSIIICGSVTNGLSCSNVLIGSVTLTLMLAFGLGILFNFDQLLLQFHLLSFITFWQLEAVIIYFCFSQVRSCAFRCHSTITGAVILAGLVGI